MKKYAKQSVMSSEDSNYMNYTLRGRKFGVHLFNEDIDNPKFQVSEIHPYDDADYAWARCGYTEGITIQFIKDKKIVYIINCDPFDEVDYEEPGEYFDALIFETCDRLLKLNRDVKPIMVHN